MPEGIFMPSFFDNMYDAPSIKAGMLGSNKGWDAGL